MADGVGSVGRGFGGGAASPMPAPPVLSYADERGLLEELEQAASGRLDFRTPVREREKQAQLDRQLLPYVSVFEARTTPTTAGSARPARPTDRDRAHNPPVSAFPNLSGFATTPGAGVLAPSASPSRPQLMSRRDEIEAESAFDFQNVEVAYAQMITKLGMDTLDQDISECLRNSFIELEAFCLKQSYQLQSLTQRMMHNTVKYVSYKQAAAEMRQEAATWCLMRHLFYEKPMVLPEAAAGAMAAGGELTAPVLARVVAERVLREQDLTDLANVVSWLEFLAGLDMDEMPSKTPKVGAGDGIWAETKTQCSIRNAKVVSELDPDAPTRQQKELSRENVKGEEKLLQVVWSLLRAGRLRDACNICRECGQPWRAASLGVAMAGGPGPIPVGEVAAAQPLDPAFAEREFEAAADEYDVAPGLRRFLWKLSCHEISESCARTGHFQPVDATMQGTRPLYEAATYGALCGNLRPVLRVCSSWEDVLWAYCRSLLEHRVDDAVGDALPPSSQAKSVWLGQRPTGGQPKTMREIFESMEAFSPADGSLQGGGEGAGAAHPGGQQQVAQERQQMQRQVQVSLILKDYPSLMEGLRRWVLHPSDHAVGEFTFAEPPASPGMMRFSAHLVLFLRFLGIVDGQSGNQETELAGSPNEFSEHQDLVNKILQVYIIHLMDTEQHDLIPVYAAHLRDTSLDLTYMIFLDEMMKYSLIEQQKCYSLACRYLGESVPRLVCKYAAKTMQEGRGSIEDGAEHRANACLWLCYEETMYHSALTHTLALCRDFALGGRKCYEAASTLLLQVLPDNFWKWLAALKFEASHADVNRMDMYENDTRDFLSAAQELEDWRDWYDFQDALRKWKGLHQVMVQQQVKPGSPSVSSPTRAESIQSTGEKLIDHALRLLTRQWLQMPEDAAADGHFPISPAVVRLTCQPVHKPAGQEGIGFTAAEPAGTFNPEALESALQRELLAPSSASTGGQRQPPPPTYVARVAGLVETDRVEISVQKAETGAPSSLEALEQVAYAVGWAIKGNLSQDLQDIGLNVQHLDCGESQTMCRMICRQVCLSKLVLQCIYVRHVLSSLPGGAASKKGHNLVETVVETRAGGDTATATPDSVASTKLRLTQYLTPFQCQELVLMEREATINELDNSDKE